METEEAPMDYCPNCGSECGLHLLPEWDSVVIMCDVCGVSTDAYESEEEARVEWRGIRRMFDKRTEKPTRDQYHLFYGDYQKYVFERTPSESAAVAKSRQFMAANGIEEARLGRFVWPLCDFEYISWIRDSDTARPLGRNFPTGRRR